MKHKNLLIGILILLVLAATGAYWFHKQKAQIQETATKAAPNPYENAQLDVKTYITDSTQNTWGYDVYLTGALYIHQPYIPAISGNRGFRNEQDANKVGSLAAYKIKNNVMPPSITIEELDSLGVLK